MKRKKILYNLPVGEVVLQVQKQCPGLPPLEIQRFVNNNREGINNALRRRKVFLGRALGMGANGVVYSLMETDRSEAGIVAKITADYAEALASNRLKGKKKNHVIKIIDVKAVIDSTCPYYLIIMERIKGLSSSEKRGVAPYMSLIEDRLLDWYDDVLIAYGIDPKKWVRPTEYGEVKGERRKGISEFEVFEDISINSARGEVSRINRTHVKIILEDVEREVINKKPWFPIGGLLRALGDLLKEGIFPLDIHAGNIGRDVDGEIKWADIWGYLTVIIELEEEAEELSGETIRVNPPIKMFPL